MGIAFALCAAPSSARDKTDVIVLQNGDRITGEITELEYGLLRLSTNDMDTVSIEWSAIAVIDSGYQFDVELAGGRRHFGAIGMSADGGSLIVRGDLGDETIPMSSVVRMSELESGLLDRVSGSLSVGFNYTKSSGIRTGSLDLRSQYQAERLRATLDVSALETSSPEGESSARERISSTLQFRRARPGFLILLNSLERNDELGVDARLQSGAAFARYFRQDQDSEIMALAGVVANQEWTNGVDESQQSAEGVIGAQWRIFRFRNPEVSLSSTVYLYPSLTEAGRHRGSVDVSLRRELVSDLFLDVSLYESYDSDSPIEGETTDYGIVTSVGYKF